ncbi:glycosyltransferase family 2 protein [Parafrigoribacterium soli]|uniref:glycosyltransferase family 2 protein n=1 Tax=Parafrigoribacterium soli TaxID=3144663 RepID=UPI0032ECD7AC
MATLRPPSDSPTVAVITVSYGSEAVLSGFLASISAASTERCLIVVADNKAASGTAVARIADEAGAAYLPLSDNRGYGAGMNAAAASLPREIRWVLISNPDVILAPEAIDLMVATGEEDDRIGSVGPVILTATGDVYPSARSVPSLRNGVGHALFANLWISNPWSRAYRNESETPPHRRDVGWLSGACVLVRRSAFDEIGGFDSDYFMYFEDVDLGFRLGQLGYRNVYQPSAVVTHAGAHSTSTESSHMISAHHESAKRFLKKKYSAAWLWPVRSALTVGLSVRSALVRHRMSRE